MGKFREWKQGSPEGIKRIVVGSLFFLLFSQVGLDILYADNAEVLPKGVSRAGVNGKFYSPADERYNPEGDVEDVAADYNTTLDSSVFSDLALVETAFGLPAGSANIGKSVVSFEYDFTIVELTFQYGITEKLTVGMIIPYWRVKSNVGAGLDTSNATVGKSAIGVGFGAPLVPLAGGGPFGDAVPLTTEDTQNLIGSGLDINGDGTVDIQGFGYKPIKNWSGSGIADIEAGFRYQYFKTEDWRLAFTGGVRFPTGEVDDPDNLVDYGFGSGSYALLFHFNNDYIGIENLVLNATFRYDLYLPDKETLRVPDDASRPITSNKEEVERDLGDVIELEASGIYQFSETFSLSLLYKYGFGLKDKISGNQGFNYKSLEDETDYTEHVGIIGLAYSTIPLFRAKKFPIPLAASISYRNRFAGSNNVLKSQYIGLGLQVYF
jgi:hypothetical protein